MSDTIKKYWEMVEDGLIDNPLIFESPDGGKTVTSRPFGGDISERKTLQRPIVSEGHKKLAYTILIEYPEEAILEAARILKNGE